MTAQREKHLLVDGSNLVHAWPSLRALMARGRDAARSQLCLALGPLHDSAGLRITVVFDGRASALSVDSPSGQPTFAVAHTPAGTTADDVIERMVAGSPDPAGCLVATDDRALRQTVESLGASGISSDDLLAWVARAGDRQAGQRAGRQKRNDDAWRAGA